MGVIMGVCTGCGRHTTAGGSESGIIPRVPGVSGIVTSVPRSQESAGCIGDNQRVVEKWEILLQVASLSQRYISVPWRLSSSVE